MTSQLSWIVQILLDCTGMAIYVLKLRLPCWEKLLQTEATAQNVSHFSNSHTIFLNSVRTKSRLFSTSTQDHSASWSLRRHRLPYNKVLSGNYMGKMTVLKYWFEVCRDDQFPQTGITTQPAGWCPGPRGNIFLHNSAGFIYLQI